MTNATIEAATLRAAVSEYLAAKDATSWNGQISHTEFCARHTRLDRAEKALRTASSADRDDDGTKRVTVLEVERCTLYSDMVMVSRSELDRILDRLNRPAATEPGDGA